MSAWRSTTSRDGWSRKQKLGLRPAGEHTASFDGSNWAAGIYLYRVSIIDPRTGEERSGPFGRMVLLK